MLQGPHGNGEGAPGGATCSTGPRSTHISRDRGLADRMLLCSKKARNLVKVGVQAMTEVGQWNAFSTHPLIGREVLTMGSYHHKRPRRGESHAHCRSCRSPEVYGASAPSRAGTKIPRAFSPVVSATVPSPYPAESQTHPTQMVALLGRCPEL